MGGQVRHEGMLAAKKRKRPRQFMDLCLETNLPAGDFFCGIFIEETK